MAESVKNLPAVRETQVRSLGQKTLWRREWLRTPVFLPGEFHEERSLAGYSQWGCKELDTTVTFTSHTHIEYDIPTFPLRFAYVIIIC